MPILLVAGVLSELQPAGQRGGEERRRGGEEERRRGGEEDRSIGGIKEKRRRGGEEGMIGG